MMLRPKKNLDPNDVKTNQYPSIFMNLTEQSKAPSSLYEDKAYSRIGEKPALMNPTRSSAA